MWKDALAPICGGAVSLLIIVLSSLVLADPSTKYNPSGNTFAAAQLVIGILAFIISLVLAVVWWRRKRDLEAEYSGPDSPPSPNCCYTLLGFLVAISVVALSALILQSESEKEEDVDPSGIFIFASVTIAIACVVILLFGTSLALWCVKKCKA